MSILNDDVLLIILSTYDLLLYKAQLISKNIRNLTKNIWIYKHCVTPKEIDAYVNSNNLPYRMNCGGYQKTRNCMYIQDVYMIKNNNIMINHQYDRYYDIVRPCVVGKFDFIGLEKYMNKDNTINCEMDFITQCQIYRKRFYQYDCKLLKNKIKELLYDIVTQFKLHNGVSYSYLIHTFNLYKVDNNDLKDFNFINQDTNVIVDYIYDKIDNIVSL